MDTRTAVRVVSLSKKYNKSDKMALSNLNLSINKGEIYGFLGPNGAGKSTTIRLLMNFLQPTKGEMYIDDRLVGSNSNIYKNVGYLSGDFVAYPKLTGKQFLDYMSAYSLKENDQKYISSLAKRMDIDLSKKIGSLSKGNRQKIGIIQAMMNKPDVLILDEPTSGLDPLKQEVFYELIAEAKKSGAGIFFSSHNLAEVQKICDRVGIIREGVLVHESTLSDLELGATQTFEITFINKPPLAQLKKIKGVSHLELKDKDVILHLNGEVTPLISELAKYRVLKINSRELDLENEFMRFYEKGSNK
ncbi:ABC transporter ATP-binding protein [Candidatus Saccharibacteria bacterium]|nr:ABC transporter ATP-binding protein [Candidatus Saccharibacteria bacterium]